MWHAIPVPTRVWGAATAAAVSGDGPAWGDFGIRQPGVEAGQGDTLSADANFLTGLVRSLQAASGTAGEQSAILSGSSAGGVGRPPPRAWTPDGAGTPGGAGLAMVPNLATQPGTEVQRKGGGMLEASGLLAHGQAERTQETQGESNGAGEAAPMTGLVPDPAPVLVPGLVPLLTNGAYVAPAVFTPVATGGAGSRVEPDSAYLDRRALDGSGFDHQILSKGFTLDSREWLRAEHPPMGIPPGWTAIGGTSTDPTPVAVPSPVAHSLVSVTDQLSLPPVPPAAGRPLLPDGYGRDGHGPMPSLAGVNLENEPEGAGAIEDPLSFVVRLAAPPPLGGNPPELPKLRESGKGVGLAGSVPGPHAGPLPERAFDRAGQDPGTVQGELIAALDSSVGGQAEGGDPQRSPLAGEESEWSSAIPGSGGEHDFSSWVPGHGAEMAGLPARNESGPRPGVTSAKLDETAQPTPELAPERLTAAPRELVLTIPGRSDGEGVLASVHVRDRNGAVEIAVRTPDAQLSSSLQDGLPELVARLETQGTTASATRGDQMSGGPADGGPADGSGMPDGQPQERQPQEGRTGQEPRGGGRDERQPHPEDRGQPRGRPGGQPVSQIRELRQQRQARWQASLGLASR